MYQSAKAAIEATSTSEAGDVPDVRLSGVRKTYGDVVAVDRVDLDIRRGEFFTMLGPSGSGKTTMLRMVAGFELPDEGLVELAGTDVTGLAAYDRDVNTVFQDYALFPHMTVGDNVEYGLRVGKVGREERGKRRAEALEMVRLPGYDDRKPNELSGGQRQRVALARAIVRRPEAFLMDEPLSNLDAKLRAQTRVELVQLHEQLATTFIYVTHDQIEAMTMADRIAVIADGRLQQVGPPQAVYDRPENLFVARFIGSPPMDVVEGTVTASTATEATVDLGEAGSIPAAISNGQPLAEGRRVVVGIRPEHLTLGSGGLRGGVTVVESLGHERHLFVDLGGNNIICRQSSDEAAPAIGERVELSVKPEHVHLFDPESTERVN